MLLLAILYLILLVVYGVVGPNWVDPVNRRGGLVSLLLFIIIGIALFWNLLAKGM